jgi:hypothetical protein
MAEMQMNTKLRLSAIRAFLGRIHRCVRLIKIRMCADRIELMVVIDGDASDLLREDISEAESEIAADFPDLGIDTRVLSFPGALPAENLISEGWIYLAKGESI